MKKIKGNNPTKKSGKSRWKAALGLTVMGLTGALVFYQPTVAQTKAGPRPPRDPDGPPGRNAAEAGPPRPDDAPPDGPPQGGLPGMPPGGPLEEVLSQVHLTAQQQQQVQQILEEEHRRTRSRISEILTPEQRAIFQQFTPPPGAPFGGPRNGPGAGRSGPGFGRFQRGQGNSSAAALTNRVSITLEGIYRYVRSNGIPDHATGQFPNRHNPNTVQEQDYTFRMLANPKPAAQETKLGLFPFAVALNGIAFDPSAAEFWNNDWNSGWQYDPLSVNVNLGLDENNAHVQPDGAYHYHGLPTALMNKLKATSHMTLIGYAADGFPLYAPYVYANPNDPKSALRAMKSSYRLKTGTRPGGDKGPGGVYDGTFTADYEYVAGSGDLDECNGRSGVTPEYPHGTYYYVLSTNWPIIPRVLKGTPDATFLRHGHANGPGPGGFRGGQRPGGPPPFGRPGRNFGGPPPFGGPGGEQ
ncbi:MAG: YHYH protein [Abitibacteriaceae bacterium]|nr:YHYH protein [Abditibacteriaceae bacterium]